LLDFLFGQHDATFIFPRPDHNLAGTAANQDNGFVAFDFCKCRRIIIWRTTTCNESAVASNPKYLGRTPDCNASGVRQCPNTGVNQAAKGFRKGRLEFGQASTCVA
jgi:hypothetical protein